MTRARLAVLASGGGSNLQAVLDACAEGRLDAEVVLVGSNVHTAGALQRAESVGVPTFLLRSTPTADRAEYDRCMASIVSASQPDFVVLAGWLRLLSMEFLGQFPGRVVNLHPALPGELPGLHAIERAHTEAQAGGRTRSGVMVHLVPDEGVDDGPVLATVEVPVHRGEALEAFADRIHAAEHRLLVDALRSLVADQVLTPP